MLGKGHKDADGCGAADGEVDGHKQTELEEVKEERMEAGKNGERRQTTQIRDHGWVHRPLVNWLFS